MYFWYYDDAARLKIERDEIDRLKTESGWLTSAEWSWLGDLSVDCVIRIGERNYKVRMSYPRYFPNVPPVVRPISAEQRWTSHQYGDKNGALCLEWGKDNWQPSIAGADMLRSTHRLLCGEILLDFGLREEVAVPSRHRLNVGQELRTKEFGYYVGKDLREFFSAAPFARLGVFRFSTHLRQENTISFLHEARFGGLDETYFDTTIPEFIKEQRGADKLVKGVFIKLDLLDDEIKVRNSDEITEIIRRNGFETDVFSQTTESLDRIRLGLEKAPSFFLIFDKSSQPHFFWLGEDGRVITETVNLTADEKQETKRLPVSLEMLAEKKICIVGAGSAGSKIAMSLARIGAGELFLVDYDVFLPENIERHVLDWNSVGSHKVAALEQAIKNLGTNTKVTVSKLDLNGQESNAAIDARTEEIGRCDLIVDATAEADVFNLLAGICTNEKKPFVWLEVFAGGKGGLIARSRPKRDPNPFIMRGVYNLFCNENPPPVLQVERDYSAENAEGEVMTASDADVSIIAHHVVRLATDSLRPSEESEYGSSMYLVGLSCWWVFQEPLHTIPLNTDAFIYEEAENPKNLGNLPEQLEFINNLIQKQKDETVNSASDA
jgi:molybdopterin/thiamine biosynthesis adenylyltransferase